jgi:hypothetical protein
LIYRNDANPTYAKIRSEASNRAGIILSEDNQNNIIIEYDGTGSGDGNYLSFYSGVSTWAGKGTGLNYVPSNGRVGIGTASPRALLDVSGPVDVPAIITSGASSSEGDIAVLSGEAMQIGHWDNGTSTFTNRIHINSSGDVGIGTVSPVALLNIQGLSGGAPPTSGTTSNGLFRIRDNYNVTLDIGTLGVSPWSTWLQVADATTMGGAYPLVLNPNGGNVGIGTDSPQEKLDVRGAIVAPVVSYSGDQDAPYLIAAGTTYDGTSTNWATEGFQHRLKSNSGGTPRVTIDTPSAGEAFCVVNNGSVGIGINSPTCRLTIDGGTGVSSSGGVLGIRQKGDTSDDGITLTSSHTNSTRIYKDANGHFNLYNTGGGNFTFQNGTGNVGIGTTSPQSKLNVHGTISTGRNLAREVGSVISYSSQYNTSRGAANVINGSKNFENGSNDWITADGQRANAYVVIDLGAAYAVDRLVIYNQNEYDDSRREVKGFKLQGSTNNSTWVDVITSECGRSNGHEPNPGWSFRIQQNWDDDNEGTSYRYWKFIMTSFHGTNGYGGITELELYETSDALDDEVSTSSLVAEDVYSETGNFSRGVTIGKGYGGTSTGANNFIVEGNVGIGTTSPGYKLDIHNSTKAEMRLKSNASSGDGDAILYIDSSQTGESDIDFMHDGALNWRLRTGDAAGTNFQIHDDDDTARFVIKQDGNVGIGTTSPTEKLDVNGTLRVRGATTLLSWNDAQRLIMKYDDDYRQGIHFSANDRLMKLFSTTNDSGGAITFNTRGGSGSSDTDYGTERMRITSGGNVGIGTDNPAHNLDIYSNHASDPTFIRLIGISSDRAGIKLGESTNAGGGQCVLEYDGTGSGVDNRFQIYSDESTWKGKTEGFTYIPENGRVGIGTQSPGGLLHICSGTSGDAHLILQSDTDNNNETDNPKIVFRQDGAINTAEIGIENTNNMLALRGTGGIAFYDGSPSTADIDYIESTSTELMRIDTSGRVGIGTASPARPLTIESSSFDGIRVKRTTAGGGSAMEFINGNGDEWTVGVGGTGTFGIYDGATFGEQFTIDTSGNVGIGNTNPAFPLTIGTTDGNKIQFNESGTPGHNITCSSGWQWNFNAARSGQDDDAKITFNISGSSGYDEIMRVNSTGVGIGTTSPATKLHVDGSLLVGAVVPYGSATHTDAQLILGGTHNDNTDYNTTNQIKLLISGGDNDSASPYYIMCEDENGHDQFWVKGSTSSLGNTTKMFVNGSVGIGTTSPGKTLDVNGVLRSRYTAGRLSGTFDTSGLNIGDFAESTSAMPQIGWEIHLSFSVSTEGANVRIYGAYIPSQVRHQSHLIILSRYIKCLYNPLWGL